MTHQQILIVDDEKHMRRSLELLLRGESDATINTAADYIEAIAKITPSTVLVVADLSMPGKNGLDLLREVKTLNPHIDFIMMTAHSTVESAVTALKEGATEYLIKPFEAAQLITAVRRCLRKRRSRADTEIPGVQLRFGDMVGSSQAMQQLFALAERACEDSQPLLISGESGSGRRLLAQNIHLRSPRQAQNWVIWHAAEPLLETQQAAWRQAAHGTLFISEIGEVDLQTQLTLLRHMHDNDAPRLIFATRMHLPSLVQQRRLSAELFEQLSANLLNLPPLRERLDDLPLLCDYLLKQAAQRLSVSSKPLTATARRRLAEYSYPGNVRELAACLERALLVSSKRSIRPEDLGLDILSTLGAALQLPAGVQVPIERGWRVLREVYGSMEKELLARALSIYPGVAHHQIAKRLGMTRRIFELRLKRYKLPKDRT